MSLPRKVLLPDAPKVNIWDINTKTIAFTGDTQDAAIFIGTTTRHVTSALNRKCRIFKKWAVRPVKSIP